MILYITLNKNADYELETEKIKLMLDDLKYDFDILGRYISREFDTLALKINSKISDSDALILQEKIKGICNILESDTYMKYYYTITPDYEIKAVNDEVRRALNDQGYNYKIFISHSENGIYYIGLKIADLNPFHNDQVEKLNFIISNIEGISELIRY